MTIEIIFYKILPFLIYTIAFSLSCIAGILVYTGLSSKDERIQGRIRFKNSIKKRKEKFIDGAKEGKAEKYLNRANYPLGLNGIRYHITYYTFLAFLIIYYIIIPFILNGLSNGVLLGVLVVVGFGLILSPDFKFSLFIYLMKKIIIYQQTKRNSEIFMLYDLLINEIEMMTNNRINAYNILRNIKPYFTALESSITQLLTAWGSDEGPEVALERFSNDLGTKEAKALIGVIKNLDELERNTALNQLKGMNNMFTRSQIENYRRRRKVTTDLLGLPIKATHFIIIINFIMVVVIMVSIVLNSTSN